MAIKNDSRDGARQAAAEAARRAAEQARAAAAKAAAATAAKAAAQVKAVKAKFPADEMSSGVGGALRRNAASMLGATLPSTTVNRPLPPPPVVQPTVPPPPVTQKYTVQPGDSLTSIATKFGCTTADLQKLNNLPDPDKIMVGQELTVPGTATPAPDADTWKGSYTVQPGDSLTSIANKFGTTAAELQKQNGITDPNMVWVGTELAVPGDGVAAPAAVVPSGPSVPAATELGASVATIAANELANWPNNPSGAQYWQYGASGNAEAWCADFVSTVYGQAHAPLGPHGEGFASVPSMQAWFASAPTAADPRAREFLAGTETPQVGDVVVFDWDKDGAADHTGIVTAVREDGSFDTIEGNTNGSGESNGEVAPHTYSSRDTILGFGRLDVTPTTREYTLTDKDTSLWGIAASQHVNFHALMQANPGLDANSIHPGQVVIIPTLENEPATAPEAPAPSLPPGGPPRNGARWV